MLRRDFLTYQLDDVKYQRELKQNGDSRPMGSAVGVILKSISILMSFLLICFYIDINQMWNWCFIITLFRLVYTFICTYDKNIGNKLIDCQIMLLDMFYSLL